MAPTLVTSCTTLPPEGAGLAWGGPALRPSGELTGDAALLDERALSKLKWRCRRGLLENDLLIERFFARHEATLTVRQGQGINDLMELSDNDLLDLLLQRKSVNQLSEADSRANASTPEALEVLTLLRPAPKSAVTALP